MAATDVTAYLNLVPTDEERMLRETVSGICKEFGREYSGPPMPRQICATVSRSIVSSCVGTSWRAGASLTCSESIADL